MNFLGHSMISWEIDEKIDKKRIHYTVILQEIFTKEKLKA